MTESNAAPAGDTLGATVRKQEVGRDTLESEVRFLQEDNAKLVGENQRLRADNALVRGSDTAKGWAGSVRTFLRTGGWAWGIFQGRLAIEALAGKTTVASLTSSLLDSVPTTVWLAWTFGATGVIFGLVQMGLRRRVIARQGDRVGALERRIDAGRTSSSLTSRGDTHPRDR